MIDVIDPIEPDRVDYGPAARGSVYTESFVNSEGRRIRYRFSIPAGTDPNDAQGVLVYFHGNNTGSQQQVLDAFFPGIAYRAEERGLIPVVVVSPETRNPPQEEIRHWYWQQDALLVHELLSLGLEEHFVVDQQAIYFAGGSQGTCFLHDFMQLYGENYGGGFYGGCGCYNSPDPTWNPPESFKQDMKVLVASSTDDFLLETSHVGYGYYKHTIGLDTRKDLDRVGDHCSHHWSVLDVALDWFQGIDPIPEEPFEPHWQRVSAEENIVGIGVGGAGKAWMALEDTAGDQTRFLTSNDQGASWTQAGTLPGQPSDFSASEDGLFVIQDTQLMRSIDQAASFTSIEPGSGSSNLAIDGAGNVYRGGFGGVYWSENAGDDWALVDDSGFLLFNDTISAVQPPRTMMWNAEGNLEVVSPADGSATPVSDTPGGQPFSMTWDGISLWALAPEGASGYGLYRSTDDGNTWQQIALPTAIQEPCYRYGARVTAFGPGDIMLHGGYCTAWFSENGGATWRRVYGFYSAISASISADGYDVFATDGEAAFRFLLTDIEGLIFRDDFQ